MCDRELQSNASWELIRDAGGDDVGDRTGQGGQISVIAAIAVDRIRSGA